MRALSSAVATCVRHGGFVGGAQRFDGRAFGISVAEASAMDPQQRLLLEHGYAALHGATRRRTTLMGGDGGVFLGIERPDWALAQPPSVRGSVLSTAPSCAAARMIVACAAPIICAVFASIFFSASATACSAVREPSFSPASMSTTALLLRG